MTMPPWVTRLITVGQIITVLAAMAAIVILATAHIIDGAGAITAILVVTGASAAVHGGVTFASKESTPPETRANG